MEPTHGTRRWLTRNVVWLGVVSLLTDASSEMIVPLLPAFVVSVLGGGALALGGIEGAAEAVASLMKLASGRWADRIGKHRPFVLAGYGLSTLARPLVALAAAPWHVLLVRIADRTGKGLRSSPRDALLAASVDEESRATAYGFHRAMDHAGAVLGPLFALALLAWVTRDLRVVFALALVPGVLAVLAIAVGVREAEPSPEPADGADTSMRPGPDLVRFLVPFGVFTLGNASDAFLLLKATEEDASLLTLPLMWIVLHVVKSLTSTPGGWVADRIGKRRTILVGWLIYAATYVGFGLAEHEAIVWALVVVYGSFHGLTEGPERALVAELVPGGKRGAGFGWYHLVAGIGGLGASLIFGALWDALGSREAFLTAAGLAVTAAVLLGVVGRPRSAQPVK
ncbi:MAG: MFS transporter [Myxococcales bacterium]|nr:MFS transporter [Myxococcales bacterium]